MYCMCVYGPSSTGGGRAGRIRGGAGRPRHQGTAQRRGEGLGTRYTALGMVMIKMGALVVVVKMVGEDEHEGGGVSGGGCIKHGGECGGG